jgi:crotonobetainyl-CoA:carnitine CoA-transferase CaiB-like acyl-CoA transferase
MTLLEDADVPMLPMHDFKSVLKDPHLVATGFFAIEQHPSEGAIRTMRMPMRWHGSTPDPARPAPRQGEHSIELLQQAGYDSADIERLIAQGVVQTAPRQPPDTP